MRKCAICHKGSVAGGKRKLLRGHYNLTKKVRRYPNLQWVRLPAEVPAGAGTKAGLPNGRRVKACTECIKSLARGKSPAALAA